MNRLGLKLICLAISLLVWVQVASTTMVEATLQLPVRVEHLAVGCTYAGNDIPDRVDVRLRISKLLLLAHRFLQYRVGWVELDLTGYEAGDEFRRGITLADVKPELDVRDIERTDPIRLLVDSLVSRAVPVEVRTSGQVPLNRQLLVPPRAIPDSVVVVGPSRFFAGNEVVLTEPVDLGRFRESGTKTVSVVSPQPFLESTLEEVQVSILVAAVQNRTFTNIPVIALRDTDQPEPRVVPPVASLVLSGPVDSIRTMIPSRFAVLLSLSGLSPGIHHLKGQVDIPACLSFVSLDPDTFTVVLDDVERAEESPERP